MNDLVHVAQGTIARQPSGRRSLGSSVAGGEQSLIERRGGRIFRAPLTTPDRTCTPHDLPRRPSHRLQGSSPHGGRGAQKPLQSPDFSTAVGDLQHAEVVEVPACNHHADRQIVGHVARYADRGMAGGTELRRVVRPATPLPMAGR